MSHTHYQDRHTPKSTQQWQRAKDRRALRSGRRAERVEIESELLDLELVAHDPEDLLWGGMLATWRDALRRSGEPWREVDRTKNWLWWYDDVWDYYPTDSDWREYTDRDSCPCCDSYGDDEWDHWGHWSDDPRDAGWVQRWLDGEVHEPVDRISWDEWEFECEIDDEDEDGWLLPEDCDQYDARMSRLDGLPGDLSEQRQDERARASARGRRRSARRT